MDDGARARLRAQWRDLFRTYDAVICPIMPTPAYPHDHSDDQEKRRIQIAKHDVRGKGAAVRKGFDMATGDILTIYDADMTVPPEEMRKFYDAIVENKGDFINGSRLVYPLEKGSMRFDVNVSVRPAVDFSALEFVLVLQTRTGNEAP